MVSGSLSLPSRGPFHLSLTVLVHYLFHSPPGVLFTFPSRYWFTIGHDLVFSLAGWSRLIPTGFLVSRRTQVPSHARLAFRIRDFHPLRLSFPAHSPMLHASLCRWSFYPDPQIGLGSFLFARRYLGNHSYFLFLQVLRCFSSLGIASLTLWSGIHGLHSVWVPPFGYRRVFACLPLTVAFRCLLRPSSPDRA